jgi:hypothetical protein
LSPLGVSPASESADLPVAIIPNPIDVPASPHATVSCPNRVAIQFCKFYNIIQSNIHIIILYIRSDVYEIGGLYIKLIVYLFCQYNY